MLYIARLNSDAQAASFFSLSGFAAAGRAVVGTACTAAYVVAGHEASVAMGREEGDPPLGSIAVTLRTFDRRIGILHGAQGVEMMVTVPANILIDRHGNESPGSRWLQS